MGWEPRPGGRYYYRGVRTGGRVRKLYLGRGDLAAEAESRDAERRHHREHEHAAVWADLARLEPLVTFMTELDRTCRRMIEASLLAANFHQCNRTWRFRRVRRDDRRP
jgi:hypothetical protein